MTVLTQLFCSFMFCESSLSVDPFMYVAPIKMIFHYAEVLIYERLKANEVY